MNLVLLKATRILEEEKHIEALKRKAYFLEVINDFASRLQHVRTVDETWWAITKYAVSQLGYEDCVVYVMDSTGRFLHQKAAFGPKDDGGYDVKDEIILRVGEEGICGYVAQTGKSEIVNDTSLDPRYEVDDCVRLSEIAVPIVSQGKVIGVIDSEHPDEGHYSLQDLEILETVASMASVKFDQAKALERLANHKDELEKQVQERTRELQEKMEELRTSHEEIKQKNEEKETLLKEIHHRVKNNLQVVTSLLSLHANRLDSPNEQQIFRDCQNRIKSMSAVHEQLYQKGNLSQIDTKEYIEEICKELFYSYRLEKNIELKLDLNQYYFDIEKSVPFGLILNELIVNVLRHAFKEKSNGAVSITWKEHQGWIQLSVSDNGAGFDNSQEHTTMGLGLVYTLVTQIDGKFQIDSDEYGTKCTVEIPI